LSEGFVAAFKWALEGLLACVDVGVLLEVLAKSELLVADHANVLLGRGVSRDVASQGEAGGELFVAVHVLAFVWSLHCSYLFVRCGQSQSVVNRYIFNYNRGDLYIFGKLKLSENYDLEFLRRMVR
jgi:hypothetical protein